jgi:hypothetical protein
VRLEFPSLGLGAPIVVAAAAIYRGQDEHRRRYRFEIQRKIGITVAALINRRAAVRVRPAPGTRIPVRVRAFDTVTEVECELGDLSLTGASLSFEAGAAIEPVDGERVLLGFELPGAEGPIETEGLVRHRTLVGERLCYGVEFVPAEGGDLRGLAQQLSDWIMERQAELLQEMHAAAATRDDGR